MFKKPLMLGAVLAVVAIGFPLSNLIHPANPATQTALARIQDPAFAKAAPILQNKCLDCHSAQARVPFYANFPVARDMIRKDMAEGKARFDISGKLHGAGEDFSELDLARLEGVLNTHRMPPARFVAMHWDARLSNEDEQNLHSWIAQARARQRQHLGVHADFIGEAIPPLPHVVNEDAQKVALGNALFHDTRLSADNSLSCASCHALNKGGTDRAAVSTGIKRQKGPINAPTVFNATLNVKQFWDGRAETLAEQAGGPVNNPLEMGSNWPQVLQKLNQDAKLVAQFRQAYPDGLTSDNIVDAIAAFESTLVTPNSRFDRYLRGDKTALSQTEVKGYHLFKANCASCHAGAAMGGLSFEPMGRHANYFASRNITDADLGLYNVTKAEADKHKFKVPTLRNIAQTGPYFHDGSAKTLEEAVRKMGKYQVGKAFSDSEIRELTAFLHTLTGEYNGKPVQ